LARQRRRFVSQTRHPGPAERTSLEKAREASTKLIEAKSLLKSSNAASGKHTCTGT
jgi:hypothetical protein